MGLNIKCNAVVAFVPAAVTVLTVHIFDYRFVPNKWHFKWNETWSIGHLQSLIIDLKRTPYDEFLEIRE